MNIDFDNDSDNDSNDFTDVFPPEIIPLIGSMVYEALSNSYPISFSMTRKGAMQLSLLSPEGKQKKIYLNDVDELEDKANKIFGLGDKGDKVTQDSVKRNKR